MEWGGAEPLPRASFLRRERGGASEDSVLCVSVCESVSESVRSAKTQKSGISGNSALFAEMVHFSTFGWNFSKNDEIWSIPVKIAFLRFWDQKVPINDKDYVCFGHRAAQSAKMQKLCENDEI